MKGEEEYNQQENSKKPKASNTSIKNINKKSLIAAILKTASDKGLNIEEYLAKNSIKAFKKHINVRNETLEKIESNLEGEITNNTIILKKLSEYLKSNQTNDILAILKGDKLKATYQFLANLPQKAELYSAIFPMVFKPSENQIPLFIMAALKNPKETIELFENFKNSQIKKEIIDLDINYSSFTKTLVDDASKFKQIELLNYYYRYESINVLLENKEIEPIKIDFSKEENIKNKMLPLEKLSLALYNRVSHPYKKYHDVSNEQNQFLDGIISRAILLLENSYDKEKHYENIPNPNYNKDPYLNFVRSYIEYNHYIIQNNPHEENSSKRNTIITSLCTNFFELASNRVLLDKLKKSQNSINEENSNQNPTNKKKFNKLSECITLLQMIVDEYTITRNNEFKDPNPKIGKLFEEIKNEANEKISSNITINYKGQLKIMYDQTKRILVKNELNINTKYQPNLHNAIRFFCQYLPKEVRNNFISSITGEQGIIKIFSTLTTQEKLELDPNKRMNLRLVFTNLKDEDFEKIEAVVNDLEGIKSEGRPYKFSSEQIEKLNKIFNNELDKESIEILQKEFSSTSLPVKLDKFQQIALEKIANSLLIYARNLTINSLENEDFIKKLEDFAINYDLFNHQIYFKKLEYQNQQAVKFVEAMNELELGKKIYESALDLCNYILSNSKNKIDRAIVNPDLLDNTNKLAQHLIETHAEKIANFINCSYFADFFPPELMHASYRKNYISAYKELVLSLLADENLVKNFADVIKTLSNIENIKTLASSDKKIQLLFSTILPQAADNNLFQTLARASISKISEPGFKLVDISSEERKTQTDDLIKHVFNKLNEQDYFSSQDFKKMVKSILKTPNLINNLLNNNEKFSNFILPITNILLDKGLILNALLDCKFVPNILKEIEPLIKDQKIMSLSEEERNSEFIKIKEASKKILENNALKETTLSSIIKNLIDNNFFESDELNKLIDYLCIEKSIFTKSFSTEEMKNLINELVFSIIKTDNILEFASSFKTHPSDIINFIDLAKLFKKQKDLNIELNNSPEEKRTELKQDAESSREEFIKKAMLLLGKLKNAANSQLIRDYNQLYQDLNTQNDKKVQKSLENFKSKLVLNDVAVEENILKILDDAINKKNYQHALKTLQLFNNLKFSIFEKLATSKVQNTIANHLNESGCITPMIKKLILPEILTLVGFNSLDLLINYKSHLNQAFSQILKEAPNLNQESDKNIDINQNQLAQFIKTFCENDCIVDKEKKKEAQKKLDKEIEWFIGREILYSLGKVGISFITTPFTSITEKWFSSSKGPSTQNQTIPEVPSIDIPVRSNVQPSHNLDQPPIIQQILERPRSTSFTQREEEAKEIQNNDFIRRDR
jgi:hypothetical protein